MAPLLSPFYFFSFHTHEKCILNPPLPFVTRGAPCHVKLFLIHRGHLLGLVGDPLLSFFSCRWRPPMIENESPPSISDFFCLRKVPCRLRGWNVTMRGRSIAFFPLAFLRRPSRCCYKLRRWVPCCPTIWTSRQFFFAHLLASLNLTKAASILCRRPGYVHGSSPLSSWGVT